jgi:hypothetical protein
MSGYNSLKLAMAVATLALLAGTASADQRIRCESKGERYTTCPISDHGYVRLSRQLSSTSCVQGRTWDYDRRKIWVDDGCRAEFIVETRSHSSNDRKGGSDAAKVVAGLAILAIIAGAASSKEKDDRHYDDSYGHGGHASHVPSWMVGRFYGRNESRGGKGVELTISRDGRVSALVDGNTRLTGYVNDERLYVGDVEFDISRSGDGFSTQQVGHRSNIVYYSRM